MAEAGKSSRFWPDRLIDWLDLVVKVGAIFAAIFAVHQYLEARQDARVAKTLDYVQRFDDADSKVGAARRRIAGVLWLNDGQIKRLRDIKRNLPEAESREIHRRFISKLVDGTAASPGLRQEIQDLVSFFEGLSVCVETNLCDATSAERFFGDFAKTFWSNFAVFIEERRLVSPDYGSGLQAFTLRVGSGQASDR